MKVVSSSAIVLGVMLMTLANSHIFKKKEGIQTLVLLDDWALIETHSIFFDSLKRDGHQVTFEMANPPPTIKYYEEYFFDNIILMAPSLKEFRNPITNKDLIAFLESNHNIMIFGDVDAKKPYRSLANEFGVELENIGFEVRDYEQEHILSNKQNVVFSKNFFEPFSTTSKDIFTIPQKVGIAYSGVGLNLDPANKFVFPILRAEASTFSFNEIKGDISQVSGESLTLVAGYQTRNNQRVTITGSLSMCSNSNFILTLGNDGVQSSANYLFCKELYQWAFQQRGVLKLSNMRHNKKGEEWTGVNPENYRIKDLVEFNVDLHQKLPDGQLVPFKADDVQLEFIRLDPYHRLILQNKPGSAVYHTELVVPDTLGIYKFKISYWRYGYSFIEDETLVSCIQFRHDEYPRFLTVAFPYYANVFLTMGAGFLFVVFFLFSEIEVRKDTNKK